MKISDNFSWLAVYLILNTSRRMLISVRCSASSWGLSVCFRSLVISCFYFLLRLPVHICPHALLCLHGSGRRQEDLVSGTTFVLGSRNGSGVQIWETVQWRRRSRNKLVSVIAKGWASLLTVTLTSVLRRTKQIRLSAAVIRRMSQRQDCVYVPLL